jgi:menaquinone-dependent protoporphyrinogen oxidase
MPARRILIVYATRYGQTEKIARRIADHLATLGSLVTIADANQLPAIANYDAVIIGASIMYGRHQKSARRFVLARRAALAPMPTAFFSVSGSAASPKPEGPAAARQCVEDFLKETNWHPSLTVTFGGAMAYTKYSPIMRWFIRRLAAREGGPTDTTRDHEHTDWNAVEKFAETFAALPTRSIEHTPLVHA